MFPSTTPRTRCRSVRSSRAALPLKPPHSPQGAFSPQALRLLQESLPLAAVPFPASVHTTPPGVTPRRRLLPESTKKVLPSGSTAMPVGVLMVAAVAAPPSPAKPGGPAHTPPTVLTVLLVKFTSRRQLLPESLTVTAVPPG